MAQLITLFEIPQWLKNSELAKQFLEATYEYKIGSLKWIEEMSKPINIKKIPSENDQINNFEDFLSIKETCEYWMYNLEEMKYPLTFYIYIYILIVTKLLNIF